jgi:hypothetical protein
MTRTIVVELSSRVADTDVIRRWRVIPLLLQEHVEWADVAGYVLASSAIPEWWVREAQRDYDFVLNAPERLVEASPFL